MVFFCCCWLYKQIKAWFLTWANQKFDPASGFWTTKGTQLLSVALVNLFTIAWLKINEQKQKKKKKKPHRCRFQKTSNKIEHIAATTKMRRIYNDWIKRGNWTFFIKLSKRDRTQQPKWVEKEGKLHGWTWFWSWWWFEGSLQLPSRQD